ncbi:MAG: extracellular solute-binding protein [Nostoc sp.]|uniref:extracellular solute-binding protein n=1 Tax=Nostoc sp. TaxID=1180 RepID=UPI002FF7CCFF
MEKKYQFRTLRNLLQKLKVLQVVWFLISLFIGFQLISACSDQQKVTLSLAVTMDEIAYWKPLINQFEYKYKNIDIALNILTKDTLDGSDKLKKALVSGFTQEKPNDLLYLDIVWVPEFANKGWLMDLTKEFPPAELNKEFLVNEVENGCYGGKNCEDSKSKLYRVPFRTDIGVLYYRKDLLEQAKIPTPKTFEELKTISKNLQVKLSKTQEDFWGYLWPGKGESLIAMFTEVLHGYGGYWIKNQEVGLDRQEAVDAVKFLRNTINDISPPNVTNSLEEDLLKRFVAGKAVFMRHWPYVWAKAHESGSKVSGKIGIIPMVHAKDKISGLSKGGWGFGVAKNTKHPDEAIKAIKFFTSA